MSRHLFKTHVWEYSRVNKYDHVFHISSGIVSNVTLYWKHYHHVDKLNQIHWAATTKCFVTLGDSFATTVIYFLQLMENETIFPKKYSQACILRYWKGKGSVQCSCFVWTFVATLSTLLWQRDGNLSCECASRKCLG